MSDPRHVLRIKTNGDGSFVFAPDGEPTIVAEIHDAYGDLADFVAWQPERPGQWWLRHGDIAVLGAHNLAVASYYGDNIRLHGTPQDYFNAHQSGVCVLLWSAPLDGLFDGVGMIQCHSPDLQKGLVTALRRWEPSITVQRGSRHAA